MFVGTNCPQVAIVSESGVKRKTLAGDMKSILRIIQSIPSPKAEPFKQWMALVAADRLDQMQDPELSIQQAMADYKRLGYSDNWINQQLKAIEVRKDLTDAWKKRGVQEGAAVRHADRHHHECVVRLHHARIQGVQGPAQREPARQHEPTPNSSSTCLRRLRQKDITEATDPRTLAEHKAVAHQGGTIARNARLELEARTGRKVVSPINAGGGCGSTRGKRRRVRRHRPTAPRNFRR